MHYNQNELDRICIEESVKLYDQCIGGRKMKKAKQIFALALVLALAAGFFAIPTAAAENGDAAPARYMQQPHILRRNKRLKSSKKPRAGPKPMLTLYMAKWWFCRKVILRLRHRTR